MEVEVRGAAEVVEAAEGEGEAEETAVAEEAAEVKEAAEEDEEEYEECLKCIAGSCKPVGHRGPHSSRPRGPPVVGEGVERSALLERPPRVVAPPYSSPLPPPLPPHAMSCDFDATTFPAFAPDLPRQDNSCDCGVFVLE